MDCPSVAVSDESLSAGVTAAPESRAIKESTIASGVLFSAVTAGKLPLLVAGALVLDPPPSSDIAAMITITATIIHKTLLIGLINFYRPFTSKDINTILTL